MPITTWTNEKAPGQPWAMNEPEMEMNEARRQELTVYMNSLGLTTEWTNENI